MSRLESAVRWFTRWPVCLSGVGAIIVTGVIAVGIVRAADDRPSDDVLMRGADLFAREWLPNDPKGPGGDGLGPVYNETSCVACHHQGGPGGAGPTSVNVEILTSTASKAGATATSELHPGFKTSPSVVLHRFGVDPEYKRWRLKLLGNDRLADMPESVETEIRQIQELMALVPSRIALRGGLPLKSGMVLSQRNAPALFGVGWIDSIPNEVLLAAEKERFLAFPEIRGRVHYLKDGRIGRFGWKAESPNLSEFVLSACANELGLEVPGHHQAAFPLDPDAKAKDLDLSQEECDALVAYVRHLPAPVGRKPSGASDFTAVTAGQSHFEAAGCANCHLSRLGNVEGLYSDLLLHDMGRALSDSGSYYGTSEPDSSSGGPKTREWRTPPLWGFRDSGPYLHDGRAKSLEEAVALHGGQATKSAQRFFKLGPEDRLRVQTFLRSLSPPVVAGR